MAVEAEMNARHGHELQARRLVDDDGRPFVIHAALPAGASSAVVMLPAIAGVNDYVAARARQLAHAGHAVVAIDYFGRGEGAPDLTTPERIDAAVAALDDAQVLRDVRQAVAWIESRGVPRERVGALGFCIGGTYAVLSAAAPGLVACSAAYYGQLRYRQRTERKPMDPMSVAPELCAPLLGHFGDMDRLIGAHDIADFAARLREAQRHHEIRTYAGAPHAFDEWHRPAAFRPVASAEAWHRTLTFLDWHLVKRAPARSPSPARSITQGD
jgi:dienelactone hydrolase